MKNPKRLPKNVVPIQSCRLFHKFEDMVEFTVVKILRRGLPNILILISKHHELDALAEEVLGCFYFSWKVFTILRTLKVILPNVKNYFWLK